MYNYDMAQHYTLLGCSVHTHKHWNTYTIHLQADLVASCMVHPIVVTRGKCCRCFGTHTMSSACAPAAVGDQPKHTTPTS
jgi:hypothetical protein